MGKTGVHADDELDIGGNAENLLRQAPCHMWLTQTVYTPPLDVVAAETVSWSVEAEKKISRAPEFVRDMARRMVLRHTQKLGHTFVTSDLVDEVMGKAMPGFSGNDAGSDRELVWSEAAEKLLVTVADAAVADNIRLRAIKRARRDHSDKVTAQHVAPFLDLSDSQRPTWSAAALARVSKVPQMVRETVKAGIEDLALERALTEITLELAEEGVAESRKAMCPVPEEAGNAEAEALAPIPAAAEALDDPLVWSPEAEARLARVPEGFMRDMTRQRVETSARKIGAETVSLDLVEEKYAGWAMGSAKRNSEMDWDAEASARIARIPGAWWFWRSNAARGKWDWMRSMAPPSIRRRGPGRAWAHSIRNLCPISARIDRRGAGRKQSHG